MKTTLVILAAALLLTSSLAFAEEPAGAPPAGAPPAHEGKGPGGEGRGKWEGMSEEQKKEKFGELKAKRIANIKEHLACVEKANDFDAMKACRPKHPGSGKGGWGKRGGEGGEGRGPGGPGGEGPGGEE